MLSMVFLALYLRSKRLQFQILPRKGVLRDRGTTKRVCFIFSRDITPPPYPLIFPPSRFGKGARGISGNIRSSAHPSHPPAPFSPQKPGREGGDSIFLVLFASFCWQKEPLCFSPPFPAGKGGPGRDGFVSLITKLALCYRLWGPGGWVCENLIHTPTKTGHIGLFSFKVII